MDVDRWLDKASWLSTLFLGHRQLLKRVHLKLKDRVIDSQRGKREGTGNHCDLRSLQLPIGIYWGEGPSTEYVKYLQICYRLDQLPGEYLNTD